MGLFIVADMCCVEHKFDFGYDSLLHRRYYLQFEARMGMRIYSDVAIDDFSMSPECFGLNIPVEHLQGYNYYDQRILQDKTPHEDFVNHTGMMEEQKMPLLHFDRCMI